MIKAVCHGGTFAGDEHIQQWITTGKSYDILEEWRGRLCSNDPGKLLFIKVLADNGQEAFLSASHFTIN